MGHAASQSSPSPARVTLVTVQVKTPVTCGGMTFVRMADLRLETRRFLVLARQLEAELGTRDAAAAAMGIDATYITKLRSGEGRNLGSAARATIMQTLDLSGRFFDDAAIGDAPDYRRFQGPSAPVLTSVEIDDDVRSALIELLAGWDEDRMGPAPNDEERDWLQSKIDFRSDRRAGLEIDAGLLFDKLRRRRAQQRGKAVERPKVAPPPSRGTRKLGAADAERKARGRR